MWKVGRRKTRRQRYPGTPHSKITFYFVISMHLNWINIKMKRKIPGKCWLCFTQNNFFPRPVWKENKNNTHSVVYMFKPSSRLVVCTVVVGYTGESVFGSDRFISHLALISRPRKSFLFGFCCHRPKKDEASFFAFLFSPSKNQNSFPVSEWVSDLMYILGTTHAVVNFG